jgi:hypothetical protein
MLITNDGRPKPKSIDAMTDKQRSELHRAMSAYGGTYALMVVKSNIIRSRVERGVGWHSVIRDVKVEGIE